MSTQSTDLILSSQAPEALGAGFFAPISMTVVDGYLWRYAKQKKRIEDVSKVLSDPLNEDTLGYFKDSETYKPDLYLRLPMCNVETAIKTLDSRFWDLLLKETDVFDFMPEKYRGDWFDNISSRAVPEFNRDNVIETLKSLLAKRAQHLAEMVDGVFRALSGEHVTNRPEGFSKRMIFQVADSDKYSYHIKREQAGHINDLRSVIARFMGRGMIPHYSTSRTLSRMQGDWAEWQEIDGGAIKIRIYKKGTAHLEIHPEFALRLNEVLAYLHPMAIPDKFQFTKNPKAPIEFKLAQKLIDPCVLATISEMEYSREYKMVHDRVADSWELKNTAQFHYGQKDKHHRKLCEEIIFACGGVRKGGRYEFDYDFIKFRDSLVAFGAIPEQTSHQFYGTPDEMAKEAVSLCDIHEGHRCLEPQAGQGNIAKHMPASTTLVEVSGIHVDILKAKFGTDREIIHEDFLKWSTKGLRFDRIVMNPPFSQGRAEAHLNAALSLLDKGGVLVAVLPASIMNRYKVPKGFKCSWHYSDNNNFKGVSIETCLLKLEKEQ